MTAYRFRMESVLRIRRLQEEQARAALLRARAAEAEATRRATSRRDRLHQAVEAGFAEGPTAGWRARQDQRERLGEAVVAARAAELWAAELASSSLADWDDAARELGIVERIEEHHRARWVAETVAAEQKDLDEQAVARFVRNTLQTGAAAARSAARAHGDGKPTGGADR
jgi:flagellar export protein FliJ